MQGSSSNLSPSSLGVYLHTTTTTYQFIVIVMVLMFSVVMAVYNSTVFGPGLVHSVVAGSEVVLSCPAPAPWLLCIWVSPGGARRCQVSIQEDRLEVCGHQDSLLTSHSPGGAGGGGGCELRLVSEVSHHGVWTCMLTLDTAGQYDSLVTRLGLSVSSPPSLSLSHNKTHLTCLADHGYPAPSLCWHLDHSPSPLICEESQSSLMMTSSSHLVSTRSSLSLSSLPPNTTLLSCRASQETGPGQPEVVRTLRTNIDDLRLHSEISHSPTTTITTDITVILLCGGLCCLGNLVPPYQSDSQTIIIISQVWFSVC